MTDSQVEMRAAVAEGLCPFCGVGPFAVVAIHVNMKHGIDRREFRDMLGVYKTTSICDPGHSNSVRRASRMRWAAGAGTRATSQLDRSKPRVLSEAGKERNRQLAARNRETAIQTLHEASRRKREGCAVESERFRAPWENGLSLSQIAEQFNVHARTVSLGLQRIGIAPGDEALRRRRRASSRGLDIGHEQHRVRSEEKRRRRVKRFAELGADGAALDVLACEEGIQRTVLRDQLKSLGVSVPDGRAEANVARAKHRPDRVV